jgi:hypothetical protein
VFDYGDDGSVNKRKRMIAIFLQDFYGFLMEEAINPNYGNQAGGFQSGELIDKYLGYGKTGLVDKPSNCFLQNVI